MGKAGEGHKSRKPYEEISAIFNGNEVKIKVPKSTSKPPKLTSSQLKLQQQCTCDDEGSVCSETCGLSGENGDSGGNQLSFQIPDDICEALTNRTQLNSELVYSKKEAHQTLCSICNATPTSTGAAGGQNAIKGILGGPKGAGAQAQKGRLDKDVYILKIGKQTDEPSRIGNIEVELVTPRAPAQAKPTMHSCKQIQCEEEDIPCCVPCRTCRGVVPKKRKPKKARCCA